MKTGIVIISILLLLTSFVSSVPAQNDSIININDVSCSFIRTSFIKDLNTGKVNYESYTLDIEKLKCLAFMNNDSIVITSGLDSSYRLKMDQLKKLNRIKGNHIAPGIILGTIIGGLSGYVIGASSLYVQPGTAALLGACAGTLIGYIIGSLAVDYETLDFSGAHENDKKQAILKFLRKK